MKLTIEFENPQEAAAMKDRATGEILQGIREYVLVAIAPSQVDPSRILTMIRGIRCHPDPRFLLEPLLQVALELINGPPSDAAANNGGKRILKAGFLPNLDLRGRLGGMR